MCLFRLIREFTAKDVRDAGHGLTIVRSKHLTTKLTKIDGNTMKFRTESGTYPGEGIFWTQKVKLVDLPIAEELPDKSLSAQDRARLAIGGDIQIHCDCPAFAYYGSNYITTQLGLVDGPGENRFPGIRDPHLDRPACKHLHLVLRAMPFHISDLAKEIKRRRGSEGR